MLPLIMRLRQSGNHREQLYKTFMFVQHFGENRMTRPLDTTKEGAKEGGKEAMHGRLCESLLQKFWGFLTYNCCISF